MPEPAAGEVNIFWLSWAPAGLLPNVYADMLLALASLSFILLYIMFNVGSFVLASAAMFHILMSIPLALTVWKVVFGQNNIDFLQLVMIFLILCIGADDVFVYSDTWKSSATMPEDISGSLETRFAWTWRRAASTMFTTTLTTCICLGLTAFSTIPTVRAFGMFGSFLVLVDYLQVITWFPAVVIWHEKHMCCKSAKVEAEAKPQRVAKFLHDHFAPWLYKVRFASVFISTCLGATGIACRATLFEPVESIPLFKESHPWEMRSKLAGENFYSATSDDDDKVHVGLVYGLDAATPCTYSATSQLLPDDPRTSVASTAEVERFVQFARGASTLKLTPAQQVAMVETCEAAVSDTMLVEGAQGYCILNDLKAHDTASFPYSSPASLRAAIDSYLSSLNVTTPEQRQAVRAYKGRTGYVADDTVEDGSIRAIYTSFVTTLSRRAVTGSSIFGGDPRISNPTMIKWDNFAAGQCAGGGSGDAECFATLYGVSSAVGFGALLGSLSEFANSTIFICVGASFAVLVCVTLNVIVALYATLTVALVIGSVMGLIIAAGMKDGMYENVFTILVVGMAIDYAVHLAHFYIHAQGADTRYDKARDALFGVGISVIGGAITTVGAGIPLLFCVVMFFYTQGLFIIFTAICALFHAFFFLMPLLMIAGPEGNQGDLSTLYRALRRKGGAKVAQTKV